MPAQPPRSASSETFGQQLANQAPTARTKRQAHADFPPPGGAASEQESGDVRAADKKHETGDDRHAGRRTRRAAASVFVSPRNPAMPSAWKTSVCANRAPSSGCSVASLLADDLRRGLGLRDGHAALEPRANLELSLPAILQRPFRERRIDWHPELADECRRPCAAKSTRHDADDSRTAVRRAGSSGRRSTDRSAKRVRHVRSREHDHIGAGSPMERRCGRERREPRASSGSSSTSFRRTALPCCRR